MKQPLHIFYAIGPYFITYFGVSVTSLMENNKHLDLRIHLIVDFQDNTALNDLVTFAFKKYAVRITLLYCDSTMFDNHRIAHHVSKNTYLRLLLADVIPPHVKAGVFLDADTVITGSLNRLAHIERSMLEGGRGENEFTIHAVEEIREQSKANGERISAAGFNTDKYFNAGVMVINLESWRNQGISKQLVEMTKTHMQDLVYWDQDVLNMLFANKWKPLDPTYNALHLIWKRSRKPLIIHYAGASKPWNYLDRHPYKSEYFRYLKLTPFREKRYTDFSLQKVPYKYYRDTRHFLNYFRQLALGNLNYQQNPAQA